MQEDNVSPNDGTFFGGVPLEPVDQRIDRQKERAQALEAKTLIESLLSHFEDRIAFRDSIAALNVDLSQDPLLHQKKCEVNDMLKAALEEERNLLEELLEVHAKNL